MRSCLPLVTSSLPTASASLTDHVCSQRGSETEQRAEGPPHGNYQDADCACTSYAVCDP